MTTRFIQETEVNDCIVTQKKIEYNNSKQENCYYVQVIASDPLNDGKKGKVWSLTGDNEEKMWEKAKNYAKRWSY